jgi:molybdate transport system substrate-binding protein
MVVRRLARSARLAAGFLIISALTMALAGRAAEAAEIQVFSANGVKAVMADLVPRFESITSHKLIVTYGEAGELRRRILEGGVFDLAFLPAQTLRDMATLGKVAAGSMVDIASSDVAMAVRAGADKPDTSSADAFKRWLLGAATIVITDPASGGVSGVHFASVLQRLGIADQIEPKLRLTKGVLNAELVARGEAELAVQLAHEIRGVEGVEFVPLPPEFQRSIVFAAGIPAAAKERAGAKELIAFLSGPAAAQMIAARGMEPAAGK